MHVLLLQESRSNMCNLQQSPQQLLYNLYNSVAITELKGYAMMQFSWMLLRLYNKGVHVHNFPLTLYWGHDRKPNGSIPSPQYISLQLLWIPLVPFPSQKIWCNKFINGNRHFGLVNTGHREMRMNRKVSRVERIKKCCPHHSSDSFFCKTMYMNCVA